MTLTYPWTGAPWTPSQVYTFTGTLTSEPFGPAGFCVLAGEGGATITDGFTKITTIDRARNIGVTVPAGWNPFSMDIPVRFEAGYGYQSGQLEFDIQQLDWCAGRGLTGVLPGGTVYVVPPNHVSAPGGIPPIVQLGTADGSYGWYNLFPIDVQGLDWLISAIQYDPNPIRESSGGRIRQDATVSVTQYVPAPGAYGGPAQPKPTPAAQRQQQRNTKNGYRTYTSTVGQDTIEKIARAHGLNTATAWTQIMAYNLDRLGVRSYLQSLKPGTTVRIPDDLFSAPSGGASLQ